MPATRAYTDSTRPRKFPAPGGPSTSSWNSVARRRKIFSASAPPAPSSSIFSPASPSRRAHSLRVHGRMPRSEEHTSELQSRLHLVCRLLLEKKKKTRVHILCRHTSH